LAVHLRAGDETPFSREDVDRVSAEAARAGEEPRVVVYVEAGVARQRVLAALDQLQELGVKRIGLVLDQPVAGEAPGQLEAQAGPVEHPETLPEVAVRNVGLHIGGGPNDDASKAPFRQAVAEHFDDFRRCYPKVSKPGQGGTFGVDLRIGRNGGKARVQQPRTGMGGKEFRDCVLRVFSEVKFDKPPRGPTVISYSLRFTVGRR
jgi:hypothetical protein